MPGCAANGVDFGYGLNSSSGEPIGLLFLRRPKIIKMSRTESNIFRNKFKTDISPTGRSDWISGKNRTHSTYRKPISFLFLIR